MCFGWNSSVETDVKRTRCGKVMGDGPILLEILMKISRGQGTRSGRHR